MTGLGLGGKRLARGGWTLALAMCCSGAVAAAASAATMSVSVTPSTIHPRGTFHVKIHGTYGRHEVSNSKNQAFLIAFIQFHQTAPCKSNATKELRAFGTPFTHMYTGKPVGSFGWDFSFKAGSKGPRRVCAYLYPKQVKPGDNVRVLKRATTTFRVS